MTRKAVSTDKAPQAIGPYSQAIQAGSLLFVSGQIPIDPGTGEVRAGDIREQAQLVLNNLRAIVEEAGGTMSHVVKTTIFLADLSDFAAVNEVYAQFFDQPPPARATVEVAALPKGVGVEIEAVAWLPA